MAPTKPTPEEIPLRSDPAKRLRDLLGPATRRHIDILERLRAHYVATQRDERLKTEIELMIENVAQRRDPTRPYGGSNRREGTAVAIIGDSGAGKTTAMLNYLRNNPFFPHYGDPRGGCPLITVGVKAPCILRQLGTATLRGAGYPLSRELRENEAWALVHFQLAEQLLLFVHYEEAQRIIKQKNDNERKKIIETLAGLMTDPNWPLHLIISGLPELKALFQENLLLDEPKEPNQPDAHATLRRRTRFVEFLPVDLKADRKEIAQALKIYEKLAGVSLTLARDPEMQARLCHAGARQMGLFFELTVFAIDVCLRAGRKAVILDDYADAYAARTLEPIELNPFAVDHWAMLDTRIIQRKTDDDEDDAKPVKAERRRSDNS